MVTRKSINKSNLSKIRVLLQVPFPSEIENYKRMKEIKDYRKVYLFNIDYKYDLPKENAKDTLLAIAASL